MSDLEKIEAFIEDYDGGWDEFSWAGRNGEEVPGVGLVKIVENVGGEGQGDDRWLVLEANLRFYQKDGYYASYDGSSWDGAFYEVKPVEVMVTKYVKV